MAYRCQAGHQRDESCPGLTLHEGSRRKIQSSGTLHRDSNHLINHFPFNSHVVVESCITQSTSRGSTRALAPVHRRLGPLAGPSATLDRVIAFEGAVTISLETHVVLLKGLGELHRVWAFLHRDRRDRSRNASRVMIHLAAGLCSSIVSQSGD